MCHNCMDSIKENSVALLTYCVEKKCTPVYHHTRMQVLQIGDETLKKALVPPPPLRSVTCLTDCMSLTDVGQ